MRVAAVVMRGHRALVRKENLIVSCVGVNRRSAIDVNGFVALARIEVFQAGSSQRCFVLWTLGRSWECSFMCRIDGAGSRSETTLAWGSVCAIWRQSHFWLTIQVIHQDGSVFCSLRRSLRWFASQELVSDAGFWRKSYCSVDFNRASFSLYHGIAGNAM